MTATAVAELAAAGTAVLVLLILLLWPLDRWLHRRRPQRPDVGLAVFVEDPTCCDDGCDECGEPMVLPEALSTVLVFDEQGVVEADDPVAIRPGIVPPTEDRPWWYDDFDSTGAALAYYGNRLVHQKCLVARRDGLTACTYCAAILRAVRL